MSTMGGYLEYCGGNLLLLEYSMVLNTPMILMISPHSTQSTKDGIPHGTEHPHVTHNIPPSASHGTEYPPLYSR